MGKTFLSCGVLLVSVFAGGEAPAQDAKAGRDKARSCSTCHGVLGIAEIPDAPNLAGESRSYIARQLEHYRSGVRKHHQMSFIAEGLSNEDIADLSAWFAAIKVTVEAPKLAD